MSSSCAVPCSPSGLYGRFCLSPRVPRGMKADLGASIGAVLRLCDALREVPCMYEPGKHGRWLQQDASTQVIHGRPGRGQEDEQGEGCGRARPEKNGSVRPVPSCAAGGRSKYSITRSLAPTLSCARALGLHLGISYTVQPRFKLKQSPGCSLTVPCCYRSVWPPREASGAGCLHAATGRVPCDILPGFCGHATAVDPSKCGALTPPGVPCCAP